MFEELKKGLFVEQKEKRRLKMYKLHYYEFVVIFVTYTLTWV